MKITRRQLQKMILKEMADMHKPFNTPRLPDQKLLSVLLNKIETFLRTVGPALNQYRGNLGNLNMGHIKQLVALKDRLARCADRSSPESWEMCAQPMLDLLISITQMVSSPLINSHLKSSGGIIPLLKLSIDQVSQSDDGLPPMI